MAPTIFPKTSTLNPRNDPTCEGFVGNADLYGLGIRLGFYLQLLSTFLAVFLRLEDMKWNLLDANNIFLFAIIIASIVLSTAATPQPQAAEIIVVLTLFIGVLQSTFARANKGQGLSYTGMISRIFIATMGGAYAVWFWFVGIGHKQHESCGTFVFLFAKVDVQTSTAALQFFQAASVLNLVFWGVFLLPSLAGFLLVLFRFIWRFFEVLYLKARRAWFYKTVKRGLPAGFEQAVAPIVPFPDYMSPVEKLSRANWSTWKNYFKIWVMKSKKDKPDPTTLGWLLNKLDLRGEDTPESFIPDLRNRMRKEYWRLFRGTSELIVGTCTIIAIELTIYWNNITEVYTVASTGQLIPLLIGAAGLAVTLWAVILRWAEDVEVAENEEPKPEMLTTSLFGNIEEATSEEQMTSTTVPDMPIPAANEVVQDDDRVSPVRRKNTSASEAEREKLDEELTDMAIEGFLRNASKRGRPSCVVQ